VGLRISNGEGTVSVYKELPEHQWDGEMQQDPFRSPRPEGASPDNAREGGEPASPATRDRRESRLHAELNASQAREQELLKAVHQLLLITIYGRI